MKHILKKNNFMIAHKSLLLKYCETAWQAEPWERHLLIFAVGSRQMWRIRSVRVVLYYNNVVVIDVCFYVKRCFKRQNIFIWHAKIISTLYTYVTIKCLDIFHSKNDAILIVTASIQTFLLTVFFKFWESICIVVCMYCGC